MIKRVLQSFEVDLSGLCKCINNRQGTNGMHMLLLVRLHPQSEQQIYWQCIPVRVVLRDQLHSHSVKMHPMHAADRMYLSSSDDPNEVCCSREGQHLARIENAHATLCQDLLAQLGVTVLLPKLHAD